ncbi:hypothetical protein FSP39_014959 [Pinctada imbricata]|uniref:Endonuclease n=1 Tax=Pinctada imbricata TaxID=66713 RepID=A0AA88YNR5_PINIB|nr:hypothetical protein FSP39_014959 [Pinctada imbricata]
MKNKMSTGNSHVNFIVLRVNNNIGNDLTLNKAEETARVHELAASQAKSMAHEDVKVNVLRRQSQTKPQSKSSQGAKGYQNASRKGHDKSRKPENSRRKGKFGSQQNKSNKCGKCGYVHKRPGVCPAYNQKCHNCDGYGHFSKLCPQNNVFALEEDNYSDSDDDLFLGCLIINRLDSSMSKWAEEIQVENKSKLIFNLDTGAMCNVLSLHDVKRLSKSNDIKPVKASMRSFSGHKITPVGIVTLLCRYKEENYDVLFHVVNQKGIKPILGADTCDRMKLIQRIDMIDTNLVSKSEVKRSDIPADISKNYGDLFQGLGSLHEKYSIKIDPDATPVVHPPRRVPLALKGKLRDELDRMEKLGVIKKQTEPTPWVSSLVLATKPNGKLRVCIDPKDLNLAIKREHYPLKTVEEVVAEIHGAKIFTKLDATSGFWQIPLDDESIKLCTFNTPFGRYSFTRLPFGIKCASEVYQRKISDILHGIEGCNSIIDDTLIWGSTMAEHDARLRTVLERLREHNIKLSIEKCEFRKSRVTYVGHILTKDGLLPDPEKVRAVQKMPSPTNKQELQTFLGFITYLGKFLPNISEHSAPLRLLTEKDVEWHWEAPQEASFTKLKELVTKAPVLSYFDPKLPLVLTVDASSKGLGAAILQNDKPIAYASRALTKSQQNYSQIEKETLAISFGCTRFHEYIYGRNILVESDHKPLQSIFAKPLYKAPARLQSMLLTLQKYDLTVKYKPGSTMYVADTLSRAYLHEANEQLIPNLEINSLSYLPMSTERYHELQIATSRDPELIVLQDITQSGWPNNKRDVPECIRHYYNHRDEIACMDGLLFKGHKLIIPTQLRKEMLDIVHSSHLGIVKCKSRARDIMYWPGMITRIEEIVSECPICAVHQRQNEKEPLLVTETPDRPWSIISCDLFELHGNHYLITIDHYSKWPELAKLQTLSSSHTTVHLKSQFARYGIPDKLISDNGPQFACATFTEFSKDYGFSHITTSPHFPQGNGQAERTVQTVKNMLKKATDPYKALLAYRNTNIEDIGMSPAQMFLGRRLKTDLPTTVPLLRHSHSTEVEDRLKSRKLKQVNDANIKRRNELRKLYKSENVIMRHNNQWIPATVVEQHHTPRSYVLQTPDGRKYRRNRQHIKPTSAKIRIPAESEEVNIPLSNSNCDTESRLSANNSPQKEISNKQKDAIPLKVALPPEKPPEIHITRSGRQVKQPSKYADYITK